MLDRIRLFQSFRLLFYDICSATHLLIHDSIWYNVDISSVLVGYFGIHKKTNSVWKLLSRGCTWLAASDWYQYTAFLLNIFSNSRMKCWVWQPMIHGYTKGSVTQWPACLYNSLDTVCGSPGDQHQTRESSDQIRVTGQLGATLYPFTRHPHSGEVLNQLNTLAKLGPSWSLAIHLIHCRKNGQLS